MRKRVLSLFLILVMLLGLLPAAAPEAGAVSASDVRFWLTLSDYSQSRGHHGGDQGVFRPDRISTASRASYDGGVVEVRDDGKSIYTKERDRFKNADYLYLPFTLSVEVPAYTKYSVSFNITLWHRRNSKGGVHYWLEVVGSDWKNGLSTKNNNNTSYPFDIGRVCHDNKDGGSKTSVWAIPFDNSNGDTTRTITKQMGYWVGASKSGSALNSYHHQVESKATFHVKEVTATRTIQYDTQGGSAVKDQTFRGSSVNLARAPTRTGYTFTGWKDSIDGAAYSGGGSFSKDRGAHMVAQWSPKTPTVHFDANGGSVRPYSQTVTYNSTYGTLPTPTRAGHTFLGWYTAASGGTKVTEDTRCITDGNHTLYAHWKADTATVTFDPGGGSVSQTSKTVPYGGTYGALPTPTRTGYTFTGWYTSASGGDQVTNTTQVSNAENHILYAHWTAKTVNVTLIYNDGTTPNGSLSLTYGGKYTGLPAAPTRTNYTFTGWRTAASGGSVVTADTSVTNASNHTLYAGWSRNTYTVTFKNGDTTVETRKLNAGDKLGTLPTLAKTGYTFGGWDSNVTANTAPTGNATYTAEWTPNTYTVTFNANGGTANHFTTATVTFDQNYQTPNNPSKKGYTFSGWWTAPSGGTMVQDTTKVTTASNHTLYAHWTPNKYTVSFMLSGGALPSGTADSRNFTFDQPYGELPVPTKEGYNFVGWYASDGAMVTASTIVKTAAGHALTAHWSKKHEHKVDPAQAAVEFTELTSETLIDGGNKSLPAGNYMLNGDLSLDLNNAVWLNETPVNLCLNGHTLTLTQNLAVSSGSTLNICDCTGKGEIKLTRTESHSLSNYGTLNLYSGTVSSYSYPVQNNRTGTVNIYGGTIEATSTGGSCIANNFNEESGSGTVNVYGGTLTSNFYGINNAGSNSTVKVEGGTITGVNAGIRNYKGTVNVSGGTITATATSENTAGIINHNSATENRTGGTLHVTGGSIIGGYNGIDNQGPGTVTITGGSVTGKDRIGIASGSTGGLILTGGTITGGRFGIHGCGSTKLSGSPTITGGTSDIILDNGITVENLQGHYTVQSNFSTTETSPKDVTKPATEDQTQYFTPVKEGIGIRDVVTDDQHVVQLYAKHMHDGVEYENYTPLTTSTTLTGGGHYLLTGDVTKNFTVPENTTVDLCLNGHTLTGKITVVGTLNLYDCKGTGKIVTTGGHPLEIKQGCVIHYYGGTLEGASSGSGPFYVNGSLYLHAYPKTSELDVNLGKIYIAETLTKPDADKRCTIGSADNLIGNGKSVSFVANWEAVMGDADPAEYFAPNGSAAKIEKGSSGDAIMRYLYVDMDGVTHYPDYYGKLKNADLAAPAETRVGYLWDGWYTAETGGEKVTADTAFRDDATLYPRWTECDHTGHNSTGTPPTVEDATCTEPGSESFTCSDCLLEVVKTTDALGHEYATTWEHDGSTHFHKCTRCDQRQDEAEHTWDEGSVTTQPTAGAEGVLTYTCTVCSATRTEAIPELVTHTVTYEKDAHTQGDTPTQTNARKGTTITLPSSLTRTGYALAGWALLDEEGVPVTEGEEATEKLHTGNFTMPDRDVVFQVRWNRVPSYALQPSETIVLEDGTTITNDSGDTVTIRQDGEDGQDGSKTVIALPGGSDAVTIQQGTDGGKDKITVPPGSKIETSPGEGDSGPVITIGGDDGKVDTSGGVDAPAGSTVTDTSGNVITITEGTGGHIDPEGVVTFPEGGGGKVTVTGKDGNTTEVTIPGGGEGLDVTPNGVPLVNNPDGSLTLTKPDGSSTTITVPEPSLAEDGTPGSGAELDESGNITVPGGSTVQTEDAAGNQTTVTVPEGGTVTPDGTVEDGPSGPVTPGPSEPERFTVRFNAQGGAPEPEAQTVVRGRLATKPAAPGRAGYRFDGWFTAATGGRAWQFQVYTVSQDTTLYAAWTPRGAGTPVTPEDPAELPGGGTVLQDPDSGEVIIREYENGSDTDIIIITTIYPPDGEGVTVEDGKVTVPSGSVVDPGNGTPVRLPDGGQVGADGSITLPDGGVAVTRPGGGGGPATITAPDGGGTLHPGEDGGLEVPGGSAVQIEGGPAMVVPDGGGRVEGDGAVRVPSGSTVTLPDGQGGKTEITVPPGGEAIIRPTGDGRAEVPGGSAVRPGTGPEIAIPGGGGKVGADGAVSVPGGSTVLLPDGQGGGTELTFPEGGEVTIRPTGDGKAEVPAGTVVKRPGGDAVTVPDGGGVVDPATGEMTPARPDGPTPSNPSDPIPPKPDRPNRPGGSGGSDSSGGSGAFNRPSVSINGQGGKAEADGNGNVTIIPDKGYEIAKVTVNGKAVPVPANGRLTGLKPADRVEVTFRELSAVTAEQFTDVRPGDWFYASVKAIVEQGLMNGTGETTFAPYMNTSRAMIATILWRYSGSPETEGALIYPDCAADSWYAKAVIWGTGAGVIQGYGNGNFGPNDPITREQLAVMLWRYAGEPAASGGLHAFRDADQASGYAVPGLCWAAEQSIVQGKSDGILDPHGTATRAEAATMLVRFCGLEA